MVQIVTEKRFRKEKHLIKKLTVLPLTVPL